MLTPGKFLEKKRERLSTENCKLLAQCFYQANSEANKAQYCRDTGTQSKPVIQVVSTLNIAIEAGIFTGKDPNHEPSKKLPILWLHSHG